MQLIKNLRFNSETREALANKIASDRIRSKRLELAEIEEKAALDYLDALWDNICDNPSLADDIRAASRGSSDGICPETTELYVEFLGEEYSVALPNLEPIPYTYYEDPDMAWDSIQKTELFATLTDLVEAKIKLAEEYKYQVATLNTFFRKYSAPKHLLDAAPEFANYLPVEWFEAEAEVISINDILKAA